jgi:hypothetical protein
VTLAELARRLLRHLGEAGHGLVRRRRVEVLYKRIDEWHQRNGRVDSELLDYAILVSLWVVRDAASGPHNNCLGEDLR